METTYRKQIQAAMDQGWQEFRTPGGWKAFTELIAEAEGMDPNPLDEHVEVPDHLRGHDGRFHRCIILGDTLVPARTRRIPRREKLALEALRLEASTTGARCSNAGQK